MKLLCQALLCMLAVKIYARTGRKSLTGKRNALVHNNGVSEKTKTYSYPNCHLSLQNRKMIQGNLKLFPNLTDWMIEAIKEWIYEIHKKINSLTTQSS